VKLTRPFWALTAIATAIACVSVSSFLMH